MGILFQSVKNNSFVTSFKRRAHFQMILHESNAKEKKEKMPFCPNRNTKGDKGSEESFVPRGIEWLAS